MMAQYNQKRQHDCIVRLCHDCSESNLNAYGLIKQLMLPLPIPYPGSIEAFLPAHSGIVCQCFSGNSEDVFKMISVA